MINILHLSDLHFGKIHRWGKDGLPDLNDSLLYALDKYNIQPDVIAVTGDITSTGSLEEFDEAIEFFINLKRSKKFSRVLKVVVVPGNHDYPWYKANGSILIRSAREKNYRMFKRKLMEIFKVKHTDSSNISNKELKSLFVNAFIIDDKDDERIRYMFIEMNSMMIDSVSNAGMGMFTENQIEKIGILMKDAIINAEKDNKIIVPIALCHHHVAPVAQVERDYFKQTVEGSITKRCSITLDARAALDVLQDNGCRVILHGHQHQPSVLMLRDRMRFTGEGKTIHLVGSGSLGAKRDALGDVAVNHFFVHKLSDQSMITESYGSSQLDDAKFEPKPKWHVVSHWPGSKNTEEDCVYAGYRPPASTRVTKIRSAEDKSSLFLIFLNLIDCSKGRDEINHLAIDHPDVKICAMYDLYGRSDTVIVYRENCEAAGNKFAKSIKTHLESVNLLTTNGVALSVKSINVTSERSIVRKEHEDIMLLPDDKTYESARSTRAFIEIPVYNKMTSNNLITQLKHKVGGVKDDAVRVALESMIVAIYEEENITVVINLFMPCNQVRFMNHLSRLIEEIIDIHHIDKYTHIAYTHCEREVY